MLAGARRGLNHADRSHPTYNGAKTLPEVLRSYCALERPDDGWNAGDRRQREYRPTHNIIAAFSNTYPHLPLRAQKGENAALNTGLSSGSGDLVVLTDDDVCPVPIGCGSYA